MTNYKLPPRKWYTLEQAIKRIKNLTGEELEIDDLLHFWYLRKLELSVFLNKNRNGDLIIGGHSFNKEEYLIVEQPKMTIMEDGTIELENGESEEDFEIDYIFKKYTFDEFSSYNGLLSIYSSIWGSVDIETEIIEKGICLNFAGQLLSAKHPKTQTRIRFYIQILDFDKGRNTYLTPKDLFIIDEHLNEFILGQGGYEIEKISNAKKSELSPTIQENQINFIRALLYMDYGIETPQEAKNALNSGELGKKIERFRRENPNIEADKNFKFPSSVTLSNWYSKA